MVKVIGKLHFKFSECVKMAAEVVLIDEGEIGDEFHDSTIAAAADVAIEESMVTNEATKFRLLGGGYLVVAPALMAQALMTYRIIRA